MSTRPTRCLRCGDPLPVPAPSGRMRLYCSDRCRYADRKRKGLGARLGVPGYVPPHSPARRAELAVLLAGAGGPAAPEDRLAALLLELMALAGELEALELGLAPLLRHRASELRRSVVASLDAGFGEVIRA